jgi:hypothetical protein
MVWSVPNKGTFLTVMVEIIMKVKTVSTTKNAQKKTESGCDNELHSNS